MKSATKKEKKTETAGEQIRSIILAIFIALLIRSFLFQPFVIPSGSMKPNLLIGDFLFVTKYSYGFTKHSLPFSIPVIPGKILAANKPKIGEVVVFRGPFDPDTDYIKRVVGLPGDVVQMRDGILYVNDVAATIEPAGEFVDDLWVRRQRGQADQRIVDVESNRHIPAYYETLPNGVKHLILKKDKFGEGPLDNTQAYVVPDGHYFMVGDNRDESGDSRVLTQIGYVPENNIIGQAQIIWFSTKAKWWEVWKWPLDIRFERLMQSIK
tara:strand:- start:797 stop:1597 length:801 start_codon:yes stop_codon:yes gene_type:complete